MRTTVTLDDDVARLIREIEHRENKPFKQVLNETLRRGLSEVRPDLPPYRIRAHRSAVRPGVDVTALNRLADEMDDDGLLSSGTS
ncbi:hypothetical protein [Agilicoccus flavus]|uniref:hypothetical protein n=1 Tax=Agilicoccus flavus TaxID=2775968 RepID=UPI001CF64C11|nr:hypothetical protein [Agilicoccus flavus]